jgi:polyvinyl alcohol dehydrogenase (cytochrome)
LLWSQPTPDRGGKLAFCDPGISAAITATPEVVYAGHMDGYFRAYDANSGKVLFDFDSKRDIVGVNGVSGRGGSFGGAGPAVRNGWVVVNSGYGLYFHMPGNLLLAFAVP